MLAGVEIAFFFPVGIGNETTRRLSTQYDVMKYVTSSDKKGPKSCVTIQSTIGKY